MEEQTSSGNVDSSPTTLFDLLVSLEKRGVLDLKVTGHRVDRPSDVKRGESMDRIEVTHESYSVFKPTNVALKTMKQTNMAGVLGFKSLLASRQLVLVWSHLAWFVCFLFIMVVTLSIEYVDIFMTGTIEESATILVRRFLDQLSRSGI